ncbi:MAG: hypothetical protein BroJett030_30120 [Alphaproteobacteria bacterium]|nr:MAG: hypothetical protein BroJett030_30120 [Alphaproteobacteria bacterium]
MSRSEGRFPVLSIPASAGIGLRSPHVAEIERRLPPAGWIEVHAENYMGHSAQAEALARLRDHYPLSVHGVGLSLGSMAGIDRDHLRRLRDVCLRFEPALVSEHLAWSSADGVYLNDLLPLRYDAAALTAVAANVSRVQDALKRPILVENLSAYVAFADSTMSEAQFLAELVGRTGCGLLLDVNNVHVSAHNLGYDAWRFIEELPVEAIGEIHLAGHAVNQVGDDTVLIDDHGSRVPSEVWALYARTLARTGPRPTLIEWDSDLPALDVLLGEAMWADLLARAVAFSERRAARRFPRSEMWMPDYLRDRGVRLPALACHARARRPETMPRSNDHARA